MNNVQHFKPVMTHFPANKYRGFIQHCLDNDLEKVKDCLSSGVDVNTVSEDGRWSGLTIAAYYNFPGLELIEILLAHPDIKVNNTTRYESRQLTPLVIACQRGNSAIVSRLVQVPGLDINHQNVGIGPGDLCGGATPLYWALMAKCSDIVNILVKQPKINYNLKTEVGETLAQAAVRAGNVRCVETLIAQESFDSWNVPDWRGDTPIMIALKESRTEFVKILANCPRVDLSCRDEGGWSLVFRAIQKNKLGEKMSKIIT